LGNAFKEVQKFRMLEIKIKEAKAKSKSDIKTYRAKDFSFKEG
jgi:hypothetical protein